MEALGCWNQFPGIPGCLHLQGKTSLTWAREQGPRVVIPRGKPHGCIKGVVGTGACAIDDGISYWEHVRPGQPSPHKL